MKLPPVTLYKILASEALLVVILNLPSKSYELLERGCAIEIAITPPVFVIVPNAVIVPPVVVPAATS